jgi:iron(III) transport system substrate-binding protein
MNTRYFCRRQIISSFVQNLVRISIALTAVAAFTHCLFLSPILSQAAVAVSQEELINEAKKEGRLVFYASGTTEQTTMFLDGFRAKYPFVKTEYFRTGKTALLNRVLKENQAKKVVADTIQSSAIELNLARKGGALGKYIPNESKDYPLIYKDPEGFWTTIFISSNLLAYNSRQVSKEDAPKSYEDLLLPKWKGMIGIDSNKIEWFGMLMNLKGPGFMEKLAEQKPQVRDGNQLLLNLLTAGEYPLAAAAYEYSVETLKEKRAPVDWVALEPVIVYPAGIAVTSQAPHPYTARLFVEYMLSREGQEVVNKYGRIPARKDVASKYGRLLSKFKLLMTDIELGQRSAELHKEMRRLF